MKKSLLIGTLTVAASGLALGGACLATGNCASQTPLSTAPVALADAPQKAAPKEIRWLTSMEAAQKESKKSGKPIFADFYATWCPPCKMLEAQTYPDPAVVAESQGFVMLKIDTDKQTDLAMKYGISSLPTPATLRASGEPIVATSGFLEAGEFVQFLREAKSRMAKAPAKR